MWEPRASVLSTLDKRRGHGEDSVSSIIGPAPSAGMPGFTSSAPGGGAGSSLSGMELMASGFDERSAAGRRRMSGTSFRRSTTSCARAYERRRRTQSEMRSTSGWPRAS